MVFYKIRRTTNQRTSGVHRNKKEKNPAECSKSGQGHQTKIGKQNGSQERASKASEARHWNIGQAIT